MPDQFSASMRVEVELAGVVEVVVPLPPAISNQLKLNPRDAEDCILMV
jgi:hypothetical protein